MNLTDKQLELIDLIKKKYWDKVEESWLQLMVNPPRDIPLYELVSGTIYRNGGKLRLPELWELLIGFFHEKKEYEVVLQLSRMVLRYQPEAPNLHPFVIDAVREIYKSCPRLENYIRASHLKDKFHLGDCLKKCEEYRYLDEGEIFQHVSWGVGKVVDLDIPQMRVTIDFPHHRNKSFTFEGVYQYLTKISHDHFLALQETNPEKLKELAKNDPIELIKIILKSYDGQISQADLKTILTGKVISESEFLSWWNRVKQGMRNDPWIELGTGAKSGIRLRSEAMGYYDEMLERFEKAHNLAKRRNVLKELVQHQKGKPLPMEKAVHFISRVRKLHSALNAEDMPGRLKMLYLMNEASKLMPGPVAPLEDNEEDFVSKVEDPVSFLKEFEIFDYQCRALDRLIFLKSGESSAILQNLYLDGPVRLSQYSFEKLIQRNDLKTASQAVKTILGHFDRNPEIYIWTVRQILKKKWPNVESSYSDFTLMQAALHFLEKTRHQYDASSSNAAYNRQLQSQLRAIFTGDKFAILISVIREISQTDARHFYNSLITSPAFIYSVKEYFDNIFHKEREDLFKDEEDDKPKVHYCTAEQLKIKQDELRRIKTVEIPRVTHEIEKARGHGDLSENAEYDAAKEKQAFLFRRMESLQDLIVRARIINPESVQTHQIGVGSRFSLRHLANGETETYTLLGIWETEPEKGILSYSSPFGREFLGKKIGDVLDITLPGGQKLHCEVISIKNGFFAE